MSTAFSADAYARALRFAAAAHAGQLEPGSALPYLVHVVSVAAEVVAALAVEPAERPDLAVQCALLHDTLEDTHVTAEVLRESFGDDVLAGVSALSKDASLPKDRAMDDSLDRILACPVEIARVKLADRIVNLKVPPSTWTGTKCRTYRAEAEHILARLGHASPVLAERLRRRIEAYRQHEARPG